MQSEVDFNGKFALWSKNIWMGKFKTVWQFVKDVPNTEFNGIKSEGEHRYITGSKDCTEISYANGLEMYKIIEHYPDTSSVLDMFEEYDTKERDYQNDEEQEAEEQPTHERSDRRRGRRYRKKREDF